MFAFVCVKSQGNQRGVRVHRRMRTLPTCVSVIVVQCHSRSTQHRNPIPKTTSAPHHCAPCTLRYITYTGACLKNTHRCCTSHHAMVTYWTSLHQCLPGTPQAGSNIDLHNFNLKDVPFVIAIKSTPLQSLTTNHQGPLCVAHPKN